MKTCVKCTINWGSIYNSIKLVKSEVNFWFCMILTEFIDYTRALFDFAGSRVFSSILHVRYMLTCKIMAARDFDNLGLEQHSPIHSTSLSSLLFLNLELHFKWTILWRSIFVAVLFTWIFFFAAGVGFMLTQHTCLQARPSCSFSTCSESPFPYRCQFRISYNIPHWEHRWVQVMQRCCPKIRWCYSRQHHFCQAPS